MKAKVHWLALNSTQYAIDAIFLNLSKVTTTTNGKQIQKECIDAHTAVCPISGITFSVFPFHACSKNTHTHTKCHKSSTISLDDHRIGTSTHLANGMD